MSLSKAAADGDRAYPLSVSSSPPAGPFLYDDAFYPPDGPDDCEYSPEELTEFYDSYDRAKQVIPVYRTKNARWGVIPSDPLPPATDLESELPPKATTSKHDDVNAPANSADKPLVANLQQPTANSKSSDADPTRSESTEKPRKRSKKKKQGTKTKKEAAMEPLKEFDYADLEARFREKIMMFDEEDAILHKEYAKLARAHANWASAGRNQETIHAARRIQTFTAHANIREAKAERDRKDFIKIDSAFKAANDLLRDYKPG